MSREAFFELHSGHERESPGSDASSLRALQMTGLSGALRIADMGCGPGAASMVLLGALPGAHVTAIDQHKPFVDALRARADAAGFGARLVARTGDMSAPDLAPGTLDLIWCEGALYAIGVERGLRGWRELLAPGGMIVFSEAIWLGNRRPAEAVEFWRDYAELTDRAGTLARINAAGFELVADFIQPAPDWLAYYGQLAARAAELRPGADAEMVTVLDEEASEAAIYDRYGDCYGYAFFAVRPHE